MEDLQNRCELVRCGPITCDEKEHYFFDASLLPTICCCEDTPPFRHAHFQTRPLAIVSSLRHIYITSYFAHRSFLGLVFHTALFFVSFYILFADENNLLVLCSQTPSNNKYTLLFMHCCVFVHSYM